MATWRRRKPEGEGGAHLDEVAPNGLPDNEMYMKMSASDPGYR